MLQCMGLFDSPTRSEWSVARVLGIIIRDTCCRVVFAVRVIEETIIDFYVLPVIIDSVLPITKLCYS